MCTLVSDFFAYLFCFMFSPTFTALPLSLRYAIDCSVFRGARPSFLSFPSYVSFIDKFSVNCLTSQFQGVPPLYGIWRRAVSSRVGAPNYAHFLFLCFSLPLQIFRSCGKHLLFIHRGGFASLRLNCLFIIENSENLGFWAMNVFWVRY